MTRYPRWPLMFLGVAAGLLFAADAVRAADHQSQGSWILDKAELIAQYGLDDAARAGADDAARAGADAARAGADDGPAPAEWFAQNIPFFECPDKQIEEIYYFRWGVFRKHIKQTPDGYVVTEFLPPVTWAGKHNAISCAAGHHFREGRWLAEQKYLDDYAVFWLRRGGAVRSYSFWIADSLYQRYLVDGNKALLIELLDDLVANYRAWERERRDPNGLFWQIDDRDGMECSIGGNGYRPTINGYMYGESRAIARIAELAGRTELAESFHKDAERIRRLTIDKLWDQEAQFFKTWPRGRNERPGADNARRAGADNAGRAGADNAGRPLVDVRELHGYVPWYFRLPEPTHSVAWKQLMDPQGFYAPFGPTTAERRHGRFMFTHPHHCLWNGPSWPYATTQTLVAMANLLNDYQQDIVSKRDYFTVLGNYARSQYKDGRPWIAENLDGITGRWIVDKPRSADYNHSGYADLIINGLVGLRPREGDTVVVSPLVPEGVWDYFCLEGIPYHGRKLTILYDKTGNRYGRRRGLRVFADGREIAAADRLRRVTGMLEPCSGNLRESGEDER